MSLNSPLELALKCLDGLSVGEAFGAIHLDSSPFVRTLPDGPWLWLSGTHMAFSVIESLETFGRIDPVFLLQALAGRYRLSSREGYRSRTSMWFDYFSWPTDEEVKEYLMGRNTSSDENDGVMIAAPIGAFFAGNIEKVAQEARLVAATTHRGLEAEAGAVAVAVCAAHAAHPSPAQGVDLLKAVLPFVPESQTKVKLCLALEIPADRSDDAIRILGVGRGQKVQDTVPFCLWKAAHNASNFKEALWTTAEGRGDTSVTCGIVGGIVALSAPGIPHDWLEAREPVAEARSYPWKQSDSLDAHEE